MARICPQCSEIHFDSSTVAPLTHCRRCEADLNGIAGLMPQVQQSAKSVKPQVQSSRGRNLFLTGALLLVLGGASLYLAYERNTKAVEATATVVKLTDVGKVAGSGNFRGTCTATYNSPKGKAYTYPGLRGETETFKVYYLPDSPTEAQETRPYMFFIVSAFLFLIGSVMFLFGLFKFTVARAQERDFHRTLRTTSAVGV